MAIKISEFLKEIDLKYNPNVSKYAKYCVKRMTLKQLLETKRYAEERVLEWWNITAKEYYTARMIALDANFKEVEKENQELLKKRNKGKDE